MHKPLTLLGIETSCDETSVAIVRDDRTIVAQRTLSQLAEHKPYGGVVPEIAARSHLDHLDGLITGTLNDAGLGYDDLDAIAATAGPGLIGGVMTGLLTAKGLAYAINKPLVAVNHIEAHALSPRLDPGCAFPYLLLLMSGAHCQIVWVGGLGDYRMLGTTIDDAVGEAFDKVAKMMGFGYPGGPALEKLMEGADPQRAKDFALPRPLCGQPNANFSFSGLKTAARLLMPQLQDDTDRRAFSLSFYQTVAAIFEDRLLQGLKMCPQKPERLVVAGGVASSKFLRGALQEFCAEHGMEFIAPPIKLCTDNAAMIAWAGIERFQQGQRDSLDYAARPRWPLADMGLEKQS